MAVIWRLLSLDRIDLEMIDEINRLLAQLSGNIQPVTSGDLDLALKNPNFVVCLATELDHGRNRIIGMATIFFQWRFSGWMAEIHDVVVDTACRGRSIGDMLTKDLLNMARGFATARRQKVTIYLTSRPARQAANQMYKKHGFELVAATVDEGGTNLYKQVITP